MQTQTTNETPRCKEIAKTLKASLRAQGVTAKVKSTYNTVRVEIVSAPGLQVHTLGFLLRLAVLNEYTSGLDRWTDIFTEPARQLLRTVEHDAASHQYGSITNYYTTVVFDRLTIEKRELAALDQTLVADLRVLFDAAGRDAVIAHIRTMNVG